MAILQALYIIAPLIIAGVVHSIVIKNNFFAELKMPIDSGRLIAGKPVFGENKTWRGFFITISISIVIVGLQTILYAQPFFAKISVINYQNINWLILGSLLGCAYNIAELPNSFIKRRLSIESGRFSRRGFLVQYLIDQADSSLGVVLVLFLFYQLQWNFLVYVFLIGTLVHIFIDQLLYFFHVKHWNLPESPFVFYKATGSQIFIWPICTLVLRLIFRGDVSSELKLPNKNGAKYIVTANHQSMLDPFVLTAAIPLKIFIKLLPFRYMTANQYVENGHSKWPLKILGSFPAFKTEKEDYGLKRADQILNSGQTLFIFPEGGRTLASDSKPKPGIALLASEPDTYIIPILIQWSKKSFLRKVKISVGQAYEGRNHSAEAIMKSVYDLS